jgi:hypothetical protein
VARQERGFIDDWNPRASTRELIAMVQDILHEYRAELPLTLRQVFYRAVASYGYEKTDAAYNRLGEHLATARRAGLIRFDAIRDDGAVSSSPFDYRDPRDFWGYVNTLANRYKRERQAGQARHLIALPEAAGMTPQLARVCHPLGVPVRSGGGYSSVTSKYDLACDIARSDRPVTVLQLGDHDPSGEDMFTNLKEDVTAFVDELNEAAETHGDAKGVNLSNWVEFVRIAVTPEQIREFDLPTAPAKKTDTRTRAFEERHGDFGTVQLEALPPDEVAKIVRDAITSRMDSKVLDDILALEKQERAEIERAVGNLINGGAAQ